MSRSRKASVTVVVPAFNEETLLPRLLRNLDRQKGITPEVVVADAGSTDATRELAEDFGATVVDGGKPAAGRNAGAAVAHGSLLVFLDADVQIPRGFLRTAVWEMDRHDLGVATCRIKPDSNLTIDKVLHDFANLYITLTQQSEPQAPGYCILVRKKVFQEAGGFNEELKVAEDHEFVGRAAALSRFGVIDSTYVKVDVRRFHKEGRLAYALKNIKVALYRATVGEIDEDDSVVDYEFGDFSADDATTRARVLRKVERALIKLDRETNRINDLILDGNEGEGSTTGKRAKELAAKLREGWKALTGSE